MSSLALAMIVRDAERTLAQCLTSVQDCVQEMQIIDTGSQDQTVAIAQQFGAQIARFSWCDDFSAARNVSISGLQSDWILILDADEYLLSDTRQLLPRLLQDLLPLKEALIINGTQQTVGKPDLSKRCLFRNHRGLTFEGRIHEQLKALDGTDVCLEVPELRIGHQPDNTLHKPRNYLRLIDLELSATERPLRRAELYYHQAQSHQSLSEPLAAIDALKQSYQILRSAEQAHDFCLQVELQLLFAYLEYGQMEAVHALACAFNARAPHRPEGWFYQAYAAYWIDIPHDIRPLITQAQQRGFPVFECKILHIRQQIQQGQFQVAQLGLESLPQTHYAVRLQWLRLYLLKQEHDLARDLWQQIDASELLPERVLRLPHWSPHERRELRKSLARSEKDKADRN